jgi:hypothetical protein
MCTSPSLSVSSSVVHYGFNSGQYVTLKTNSGQYATLKTIFFIMVLLQMVSADFKICIHAHLYLFFLDSSGANFAVSQLVMTDVLGQTVTCSFWMQVHQC